MFYIALHRRSVLIFLSLLVLNGCTANRTHTKATKLLGQGKQDEALTQFNEAVAEDPYNPKFKIDYYTLRKNIINDLISEAEMARSSGAFSDAEKIYRKLEKYDSAVAASGRKAIDRERLHNQLLDNSKDSKEIQSDNISKVLVENPSNEIARTKYNEINIKKSNAVSLDSKYDKKISLEFKDATLKSVISAIGKVSEINFFYDKDIRPDLKVNTSVTNITVKDALKLILLTNELEYKEISDNSLLIYPKTQQKKEQYESLQLRSFYIANGDAKVMASNLQSLLQIRNLVVDERLGVIIIRDTPATLKVVEKLINLQDKNDPEVMLEVEILEVKRSKLLELGIKPPTTVSLDLIPKTDNILTLNDLVGFGKSSTRISIDQVVANLRKEDQNSNILANPTIRVKNKEKALIQIGDRVPVITTTSTSTGFVSESINYVDVGLKLQVEPKISLDDEVTIKVELEVSNLLKEIRSQSGALAYQIGTRNASTVLQLKNGETEILAGLISNEQRKSAIKTPFLGDIPVLGRLFSSQKDDNQRNEILLVITPRLIRNIKRPDMIDAIFDSGTLNEISDSSLVIPSQAYKNEITDDSILENVIPTDLQSNIYSPSEYFDINSNDVQIPIRFQWDVPKNLRVGEVFSARLNLSSDVGLSGIPLLISYDNERLQPISVSEGDFFKQNGANTSFSERIDSETGKIYTVIVRDTNLDDGTVNGSSNVVDISFKSIKSGVGTIQLQSATPEEKNIIVEKMPVSVEVNILE